MSAHHFEPISPRPMPGRQTGAVAWLKANLFSGWSNTLVTLVLLAVAGSALISALDWALLKAVFGSQLEACNNA